MTDKYKVVLLGDGSVGKTSIAQRYVRGSFSDTQKCTVEARMYIQKRVQVDDHVAQVAVWDTAGQERFHALGPYYYRDADGVVIVYDVSSRESLGRVTPWVKELKAVTGDDIRIAVAGNKCDLPASQRQVSEADALSVCRQLGAAHTLTSAKTGAGVSALFMDLTKAMVLHRRAATLEQDTAARRPTRKLQICADDESEPGQRHQSTPSSRRGCC